MLSLTYSVAFGPDLSRQARLSLQPVVSTVQDSLLRLDRSSRRLHLASGRQIDYDLLLVHVDRDKPVLPASVPCEKRVDEVSGVGYRRMSCAKMFCT